MAPPSELTPKPTYWSSEYAGWFRDQGIVDVYHYRPAYPPQVFDLLHALIVDVPRRVLDVGCGTGDICRSLAPRVDHVDAVDFSAPMLARAKHLPGGDQSQITWIESSIEDAALTPPYALITAGESLHWMDWDVVLPRFASILTEHGTLAMIERNWDGPPESQLCQQTVPIFRTYAAKEMHTPFDLISGLEQRGFATLGSHTMVGSWRPTLREYVECRHAQHSFSRQQMGVERAAAFDTELAATLGALCADGAIDIRNGRMQLEVRATVTWGALPAGR